MVSKETWEVQGVGSIFVPFIVTISVFCFLSFLVDWKESGNWYIVGCDNGLVS